ncbi:MAG: Na/Pi cotransporter family protein [Paludibacteraceae bacterium]|nr:Na/Pi cotransporter family protein [Paludibacteraceae bacterium]MBP8966529.1 Na/Pi cotransporter family protein [Paludibacteraceae bacterium]HOF98081.1 Na/Pi cotransporter family protein [Paludibacteraceae bacterium]HON01994.1 Na/Pi cotransporter family protein [Paludibacteraceae bacterium]HOR38640.1 Na/Pi cotransporter family protein [Paludibacteraceae bacterium]
MHYTFYDLLTLIGSLGLFLYGMKTMSEGLQKATGDTLRSIMAAMTRNRFTGILTGLLITSLIQSSSATTVMVVSFVNAGLLSLYQAITVIMGANIGTTITAWMISIFGFKVSIAAFSIPLIGISIPLIFSSKSRNKSIGEFLIGFALLFMGLELLKNSVPDIQGNPEVLNFLAKYTNFGFGSILLFLLIGTMLTIIVQSSSATMAITLIICSKGWISYELGAAMVLGENIGTTITANLAAIPTNVSAKRAALSHLIFNIFGVIWMLIAFRPFINLVTMLITQFGPGDPTQLTAFSNSLDPDTLKVISSGSENLSPEQIAVRNQLENYQIATSYGLSLFHTLFNITNTLVLIWFAKIIEKISTLLIKKKDTDEEFQLQFISTGLLSTSELSLIQAWKEIKVYAERSHRMFSLVRELLQEKNENDFIKKFSRVQKYENISDRMEVEIAHYLTKVAEGKLSEKGKFQIQTMLKVISEIESIGDSCYNLARTIKRKKDDKAEYTKEMDDNLNEMMNLVEDALLQMRAAIDNNHVSKEELNRAENLENEINNFRNQLKNKNIDDVKENKYDYQASVTYMDMLEECEKLGDYIVNIVEALYEASK